MWSGDGSQGRGLEKWTPAPLRWSVCTAKGRCAPELCLPITQPSHPLRSTNGSQGAGLMEDLPVSQEEAQRTRRRA